MLPYAQHVNELTDADMLAYSLAFCVLSFSDGIVTILERAESEPGYALREVVVVQHLNTLLQWLLVTQAPLQTLSTVEKIFTAVEFALLGDIIPFDDAPGAGSAVPAPAEPKQAARKRRVAKPGVTPAQLFAQLKNAPAHKSQVIREAAEMFLFTLMAQHGM